MSEPGTLPKRIPEPPPGAPREQMFEFGALCGLTVAAVMGGGMNANLRRTVSLYVARWYPDGLPETR